MQISLNRYALFINTLRTSSGAMMDARGGLEGGGGSRAGAAATSASHTATAKKQKKQARDAAAATCPPQDLFRVGEYEGKFATFDADGLPLTDADGEAVTKSQRKKLEKLQRKHAERWEKHNLKATTSTANDIESSVCANASASADPGADGEINTDAGTTCSAASVVAGRPTDDPNPTAVPTAKTDSNATLSGNGVDAAAASDGRSSSHIDPLSRSPQGGSPGKSSQQDSPQGEHRFDSLLLGKMHTATYWPSLLLIGLARISAVPLLPEAESSALSALLMSDSSLIFDPFGIITERFLSTL